MPRVHIVKKAQKDYPAQGIQKGETYYWWVFRNRFGKGSKVMSKTYPKPSQLTRSEFLSQMYELQERLGDFTAPEDPSEFYDELTAFRDSLVEDIRALGEEQAEKLSNMPEGLQQGDTGQLLQERADAMDGWAGDLENVGIPEREEPDEPDEADFEENDDGEKVNDEGQTIDEVREELETEANEAWQQALESALEEIQGCEPSI